MRRKLWLLLSTLCLLVTQFASAQRIESKWDEPPIKGVPRSWLRLFYFYQPRVWPHDELPANHWLNALRDAQQLPLVRPQQRGIGIEALGDWEFMGPLTTNNGWLGRINAIIVDRTDANTIYAGESKGGVWKSTDAGTSWTNLTDNITQYVGCLAQDPVNANTIYMGTGEEYYAGNTFGGVGIYKSTDGGATWTLIGNSTFAGQRINAIVVDPTNTNKWIVSSDGGIYVTTNGGTSFTRTLVGTASSLKLHPTNSSIVYAALGYPFSAVAENGVYKSTNGGTSWTKLAGGLPTANVGRIELDIHKADPNVLYVAIGRAAGYPLLYVGKSTDAGATWVSKALPATERDTWYNLMLRADPADPNIAYVGMVNIFKTINGGTSWSTITPNHPDIHALEFHPTTPATIYLGEDAGLFVSTDRGGTWTHKNNGRGAMEYYAFDVHPTDATKLAAGAQDNSTHVRTGTNSFNVVIGGDGFWTAYKKSDPNIMLGEYQYGNVSRSTNGGSTWSYVLNANGGWSSPIINDPTTPSRFYVGGVNLYRSNDDGATWGSVGTNFGRTGTAVALSRLAIAPSNGNVMYIGSGNGGLWTTTNATASPPTWTNRSTGLPTGSIGGIAVDPGNPAIVYVGIESYGVGHVWKSTNSGLTWTNFSGNLPDAAVTGVAVNPGNTSIILACSDAGVFVTNDGTTWSRYGFGLPIVPCTHIVVNATTGYATLSTYGRGMWRISLPTTTNAPTLTSINPTFKRTGDPAFTLTLTGTNFAPVSRVRWNGVDRPTTYVSSTQLTAAIPASDIAVSGNYNVTVFNPPPGGGTSVARVLTVNARPTAGLSGATLNWDGINDAVNVAHNAALQPYPLTAAFWLKTTLNNGGRVGLTWKYAGGSLNGWSLFLLNGKVSMYYFRDPSNYVWDGDTNTFSTPVVTDGNWHHIAATVDASGGKLYVDGTLQASRAWLGTPGAPSSTQPLILGVTGFAGQIDEVSLWNVARSQSDIQLDQRAQLLGSETGLVAYYRLNEGTGSTTADTTGHGYTGTLAGTPQWAASTAPVDTVHVKPSTPRLINLAGFDADTDPISYTVVTAPTFGTLSGTAPNVTYTPGPSYVGSDQFTYKTSDANGDSAVATVNIDFGLLTRTFSGSTTGTLTYRRPDAAQPPTVLSGIGTAVPYTVFKVTVPVAGSYNFDVTSTTTDYDPFATLYGTNFDPASVLTNAIVANDDKPTNNLTRSGFDNIALTTGTDYFLVVSGYNNADFGNFNGIISGPGVATVTPLRYLTGTVTPESLVAGGYPQNITFQIRPQGSAAYTRTVSVGSTGAFALINLLPVNTEVAAKGTRWLQQTSTFNLTGGSNSSAAFTLPAGDANNDNVVDITDLLLEIGAYNQVSPSAGYLLAADFNGDGNNDITDLLLLISHYNQVGNP